MAEHDRIPTPVLEAARRGVARLVLRAMRVVERRTSDPAERWRALRGFLRMMVRGEV